MALDGLGSLALVVVLGVGAQWLAWRLHLPSILLLLVGGFLAGPVLGWLDPDALLGELLAPLVSLAVALILFEGGLGLDFREIKAHGSVVARLVTVGTLITFAVTAVVGIWILGLDAPIALVLAGVLVVSGPTVVGPLLAHVRPRGPVGPILRWEGIVIDPIGAVLTALVFEAVVHGADAGTWTGAVAQMGITAALGAALGVVVAAFWVMAERRYWIPDLLAVPLGVGFVVGTFFAAEQVLAESGFFAVTVLGVALANQRRTSIRHILDFKEDLSQLLIGGLFVLLAARVRLDDLRALETTTWVLVAALVLVARPLAVAASTWKSGLTLRERAFLTWMAPRGIVAAAVAAFFAFRLEEFDPEGARQLVPIAFLVIGGTVVLYGLTARPVARILGLAQPDPQGVLLVGANTITRAVAKTLQDQGFRALIADTDAQALNAARLDGLETAQVKVTSTHLTEDVDLAGIGRLWAVTPSIETNSLAAVHFADEFGRAHVYQVALEEEADPRLMHPHLRGRVLFGPELSYQVLRDRLAKGWELRRTPITERFSFDDWRQEHGKDAQPLWLVTEDARLRVFTVDHEPEPRAGRVLVGLVRKKTDEAVAEARDARP